MIAALLFTVLFAICGVVVSEVVFCRHSFINRIWLGLVLGLFLLTWLPSLFAFFIGFTLLSQILSGIVAVLACAACIVVLIIRKQRGRQRSYRICSSAAVMLTVCLPIVALGAALLYTHILYRHADGSIWVGQVTYGDLAMHLGFLTSIAEQAQFPPQYSIFPGHALNYPFLCETSGASLYQLGADARQAYILSALYAFILVVFGAYLFFRQWLKKDSRAALATVLFFFGGGFGFFYFFDLAKSGGLLATLLNTQGQTTAQTLLDGFYQTPTNIPALGLRWVNPIVDMLIPQRATLFGWAFLFPCLYLLHGFAFEQKKHNLLPLAVFAGLLPLIHTHSFLALGILSAVYCIADLITVRFEKKRLLQWLLYALIACVLAAPQLFGFSFRQASESSLVRLHLNWGNMTDSYLWFYIKNWGLLFLLMPFAFLLLSKRDRIVYAGVLVLWLIAELVEFQPNDYDNNKLLFIWFAYTCALVSKWLCVLAHRAARSIRKRFTVSERCRADRAVIHTLCAVFAVYFLCKLLKAQDGTVTVPASTLFTLFFLSGAVFALSLRGLLRLRPAKEILPFSVPFLFACYWMLVTAIVWYRGYTQHDMQLSFVLILIAFALSAFDLILAVLRIQLPQGRKPRFASSAPALTVAAYLLIFTMTVSSVMTILRELKSEYQVYTKAEAELTEQIKEQTEPDAVVLANSYHWNLITPLTGRSIVTGTGTFLYYHGIDNTQREQDVRLMYEEPLANRHLFAEYNVRYILISNAERYNYDVAYDFLESDCTVVAENSSGTLYRLP